MEEGTPQGGSASPLMANIYLHYVFDLWVHAWRGTRAHGDVIVVRYADDIVIGFQIESDAQRFRMELAERSGSSNLNCIPTRRGFWSSVGSRPKTGNSAEKGSRKRSPSSASRISAGRREATVTTRCCGRRFKRMQAKLSEVKDELRPTHARRPSLEVGQWLRVVVGGHIRYYGVPTNNSALGAFRLRTGLLWHRALSCCSQTGHVRWDRMRRLIDRWLPPARVYHPYPLRRMRVIT